MSVATTDAVAAAVLVQDEDLTGREPALKCKEKTLLSSFINDGSFSFYNKSLFSVENLYNLQVLFYISNALFDLWHEKRWEYKFQQKGIFLVRYMGPMLKNF